MANIERLADDALDQVAGGNYNWWLQDGTTMCQVTGLGRYRCTSTAKDTFAWLMAQHQGEGWSEQDYLNELLASGEFTPI